MTDHKIRLYNNLNRKKEPFTPIDSGKVRMYVCGPTVYDRAHIGNARTVVVFDMLYRLLCEVYGEKSVIYARNYTDVDDKIITAAQDRNEKIEDITSKTIRWYEDDMEAIGALQPNEKPRATDYIQQMQDMIAELITRGFAYPATDEGEGHVLFRVQKYDKHNNYGVLSGQSLETIRAGERVEIASYKDDPADFVLWKPSNADEPGWDSPWGKNPGRGRPGWHIECSAMARALFGAVFDIHGGGLDLQFPHHENEIAQSCACSGEPKMANVWMHNEMLQVEGRKMSKSLGNFFTVRDLLERGYHGAVIRYVYLMTHYRKPMDWSDAKAEEAEAKLQKWLELADCATSHIYPPVLDALADDLNTPLALSAMDELARLAQKDATARAMILPSLAILGLDHYTKADIADAVQGHITTITTLRQAARASKDFEKADWIRDELKLLGLSFEDGMATSDCVVSPNCTEQKLGEFIAAYHAKYPPK